MDLIKVKNLKKDFGQGEVIVHALRDISLNVKKQEFMAIVGPSGSGKTTLLNCIGALDLPTSGEVIVNGSDLKELSKKQLAKLRLYQLGFIFQAYNLIPVLTAFENIEYVLRLQGVSGSMRKEKVYQLLKEMSMQYLADRFPNELSGGQQQRIAIARALVAEPALVLADEPTANLDSKNTEYLMELMLQMSEKKNITFLFSTHDQRVIQKAKRVVILEDGKIKKNSSGRL